MSSYRVWTLSHDKIDPYFNMLISKWLRSLRYGNRYFKLIDPSCYWANYNDYLRGIILGPNTRIRLATLSEDDDVVLGFSVCQERCLDYVWVHNLQRKQGIGKALIPTKVDTYSHITNLADEIFQYYKKKKTPIPWKFNPFY